MTLATTINPPWKHPIPGGLSRRSVVWRSDRVQGEVKLNLCLLLGAAGQRSLFRRLCSLYCGYNEWTRDSSLGQGTSSGGLFLILILKNANVNIKYQTKAFTWQNDSNKWNAGSLGVAFLRQFSVFNGLFSSCNCQVPPPPVVLGANIYFHLLNDGAAETLSGELLSGSTANHTSFLVQ